MMAPLIERHTTAGSLTPFPSGLLHSCHADFLRGTPRNVIKNVWNVADLSEMKTQQPMMTEDEHVVLKFRPRASAKPTGQKADLNTAATRAPRESNDLSRYERPRDEPDDFRHRMLANAAAAAFTIALTAIGIWLAMSIADLRNTQDCVLMGRQDCAHISSSHG